MKIGISDNRSHADAKLEETESLPKPWCYILFLLVAGHLLAVFSEPFHFFARSEIQTASDATALRNIVRPYSQWMFLDHGYFFFAPNPGPGHLLRIVASDDPVPPLPDDRRSTPLDEAERLDGDGALARMLPDRSTHWPRLLYHRYFMLSEFYYSRYAPRAISRELSADAAFASRWEQDRELYGALRQSIEKHFRNKNNSPFLRIDRVERSLPSPDIILKQGIRLSDRRWLSILPESMDLEAISTSQPNAEVRP
ncbi:hypothetical protein VN12_07930 [Pirellula sp. SH-Sr6A]|uniref:hypothetical protein n=1 Tax=Pirellula sp. SH-Sr6A TaxID=1632865 RepID=UPI00078E70B4|nr:hypothetical protein [Pirellula sp. SH-Sr6A]AMV32036.1 hypothetical protein VN12_07930 [Pirellula sp. SH-Sr6A]